MTVSSSSGVSSVFFDDVVNRGGVGGSSFDGFQITSASRGEPSTPSIGSSDRWSSAKVSDVSRRNLLVWVSELVEHTSTTRHS